jgi:hypothetical protein
MCPSNKQIKNINDLLNYHLSFNIINSGLTILTIYTITNIYFKEINPYMISLIVGLPLITIMAYYENQEDKPKDN